MISMLHERNIKFKLKGERRYVQGPDIYDRMLATVRDYFEEYPVRVSGTFHRLLNENGICRIYEYNKLKNKESSYAVFDIFIKNIDYEVSILNDGKSITSSCEYDETKVLADMSFDGEKIILPFKPAYTYAEQIVAMTKKLHLELFSEATGKWLFTKIQINDVINPALYQDRILSVEAERNFHYRLTQCSITLDAQRIGSIWFSLLPSKETP
jgi:hypothetical protein